MIDLETLSLLPNAAIISIGAVKFDPFEGVITSSFYQNVDQSSSLLLGMHRDPKTLDWWAADERKEARSMLTTNAIDIALAVQRFVDWCGTDGIIPWSKGAAFDLPILKSTIFAIKGNDPKEVPWKYRDESCYRTLARLYPGILPPRTGVSHNALDDATYQANHLMSILKSIKPIGDIR